MPKRRWLDEREQRTWYLFQSMTTLLDAALDRQLQRDAGMPHSYYRILSRLSDSPGRRERVQALAEHTRTSQSRVSHAVSTLEARGWVRRERAADDSRGVVVVLTSAGVQAVRDAAPGHAAEVRTSMFDHLGADQVDQLAAICETVLTNLDPTRAERVDRFVAGTRKNRRAAAPAPRRGSAEQRR